MHALLASEQKRFNALTIARWLIVAFALVALQPGLVIGYEDSSSSAQAKTISVSSKLTVSKVRPEAFSWYWDNIEEELQRTANSDIQSFRWIQAPVSPEHLGYSAGASYRMSSKLAGKMRTIRVTYLDYQSFASSVATDNFLGSKPYSFVAQKVSIDGQRPFEVLVQYTPTGQLYADTAFQIDARGEDLSTLEQAYINQLGRTFQGLSPRLTKELDTRYFNEVLQKRGSFSIGPVDGNLNVTLTVKQEIKGITPEMLSWWWDHIGNTARYRLWQPIDHVSFNWDEPPTYPDLSYDIGAKQKVREYIGPWIMTLDITGADPHIKPPPVPTGTSNYFYADADLSLLAGILPSNKLVHSWTSNATGDGVVLTSTFVNTALARAINFTFFEDLGAHALREFQMMPYFLPRLYKREYLKQ